jgi:hypothetical protein
MSDKPTRTIEDAQIVDHYDNGEMWLRIEVTDDVWLCKWDRDYGDGIAVEFFATYGLPFDRDSVLKLVNQELPVTENKYGDWEGIDRDRFGKGGDE